MNNKNKKAPHPPQTAQQIAAQWVEENAYLLYDMPEDLQEGRTSYERLKELYLSACYTLSEISSLK